MSTQFFFSRRYVESDLETPGNMVYVARLDDGRKVAVKFPIPREMVEDPDFDQSKWDVQMEQLAHEKINQLLAEERTPE